MVFHKLGFFQASWPSAFQPYRLYDMTLMLEPEAEAAESRKIRTMCIARLWPRRLFVPNVQFEVDNNNWEDILLSLACYKRPAITRP